MRHTTQAAALLLVCGAVSALYAQDTVIYRCTDASGALTMQNDLPCAKGMKQEIRTISQLPTAPPPARVMPPPSSSAPPPIANFELVVGPQSDLPASILPDADRKPPPALFQCKTWDEDAYLSENGEPDSECAPLTTVGIGGNANIGAGAACEMRRDECAPVAADTLCQAWGRQVGEAEFRWKYANAAVDDPRKAEYDRVAQLVADSNCPR